MQDDKDSMTPVERRASIGLAGIYGLRMLGLFIILPIFAIYAQQLPGGESQTLIGIALGAYGLTQAILQIPAGWLSDHYGRKPVIYAGLILFAIGSFIAASADDIYWIIAGRVIQGAGAINAAVMALTADLTREEHRTKAMAMIGITIGITFSISLVLSPFLYQFIGVPGIFKLIGVLALLAMAVVAFIIPNPAITRFHSDTEASTKKLGEVLRNRDLLRLDFGIFSLHAILMSVFMQVPFILRQDGLAAAQHWQVYLPVMLVAFALMVPPIIIAEKKAKMKQIFMGAVALAALAQLALLLLQHRYLGRGVGVTGFLYFVQRAGSNAALNDQQDRAARCQGDGNGRIQQRAISRCIFRCGGGRFSDAAFRRQCGVRFRDRLAAVMAAGGEHHAASCGGAHQTLSLAGTG